MGRNDSRQVPPPWASFFGAEGWARFIVTVTSDLERRRLGYTIDPDSACVRLADGMVLGLNNLAQMCRQASADRWPGIVAHHFGVAIAPADPAAEAMVRDFQLARRALKLRLWERGTLPSDNAFVAWDVAEDLVAVLTFDLPQMLMTAKREEVERWQVPKDDLWRIALGNVYADGLLAAPALDAGNGAQVHVLEGEATFFAASHALFLEAYVGASALGAVVAVPRRHVAVFHPIVDLRVVHAVTSMLAVVPKLFREGPGSITPSLYWWRPGQGLLLLPWQQNGATVDFHPPSAFVEMLNRLPPAPHVRD